MGMLNIYQNTGTDGTLSLDFFQLVLRREHEFFSSILRWSHLILVISTRIYIRNRSMRKWGKKAQNNKKLKGYML